MPRANPIPPPITGDVYRFNWYSTSQGQTNINTFDVMGSAFASTPATNMAGLLAAWVLANQTAYASCLSSQARLNFVIMQCISNASTASIQQSTGASGAVVAAPLPIEIAAIVKRISALKGQHGRGRIFIPAVPTTFTTPATDPNMLNAAGIAAYNAFAISFFAPVVVGGTTYLPVISKKPIGPLFVVTNAAVVTSVTAIALLATQRRRKPGRGI